MTSISSIFGFYAWYLYFTIQISGKRHSTFGQSIFGLKTLALSKYPMSFSKAFVRSISFIASACTIFGILIGLFNRNRRCLHDIVTFTQVYEIKQSNT